LIGEEAMQQTWHIFLKDARRLRYEITVMLVLTAAYAWSQGHWQPFPSMRTVHLMDTANMLRLCLLPMAWWFLASLAVYGERLPGDRQFWITRPYRWSSLLGAKLLFIVAFVSLPLALADCFILLLQRLRPWESPLGFLWHELTLFAVVVLPMIAMACITANFGQAILLALAVMVPMVIFGRYFGNFSSALSDFGSIGYIWVIGGRADTQMGIWLPLVCLVAVSGTLVITVLQYRTRRTGIARIFFAAVVLAVVCGGKFLPDSTTLPLQSPLLKPRVDTSSISAAFWPESAPLPPRSPSPRNAAEDDFMHIKLPIRFDGVPPGTTVVEEMMFAEVTLAGGKPWSTLIAFGADPPDTVWHEGFVDRSLIERVKGTPVRVHLTIQLTVLGNAHSADVPIAGGPYRVPGVGLCQTASLPFRSFLLTLNCRTPFRQPPYVLARFEGPNIPVQAVPTPRRDVEGRAHYSPYPADFGINPISDSNWAVPPGATRVAFTTLRPLAHIRRELDIPSVQLADYAY
jgi:hypothetical protein